MAEQGNSRHVGRPEGAPMRRISGRRMESLVRSAALGDIVSVLMRAPRHKALSLATLRVNVLPALLHNQYIIARVRREGTGESIAAALALWASVSDEVNERLSASRELPLRLTPEEWKSGSNLWLIDLVAPTALAGSMLKDLDEKVGQGRSIATHALSSDGTTTLTTVRALLAGLAKPPA
jgi:cytolysin-activating lysine-acyltransferase